ncbi:MAG: hypothetical protein IBX48_04270 [Thiomicrospira sp.]|uniref:hypothetical protein n=1 Tax=Thiomicrospira sp. TaxID=935 RepID=UPI001A018049|nr:hypothetical protein [Thiomicrospira sp.]MBE0493537.1 hypothetical protein [Thiomicrospira sp.]
MNLTLMDIDLLSPPPAEPLMSAWLWALIITLLLVSLIGLVIWLWRSPGLVVWRWRRRLAGLQTDQQRKQLALDIYDWLAQRHIPLDTACHQALLTVCFSANKVDAEELANWLTKMKACL